MCICNVIKFIFPQADPLGGQVQSKQGDRDTPGGPVVENLPSNAGDSGSVLGWGTKIPHASEQRSPHASTTDPQATTRVHAPQQKIRMPQEDAACSS